MRRLSSHILIINSIYVVKNLLISLPFIMYIHDKKNIFYFYLFIWGINSIIKLTEYFRIRYKISVREITIETGIIHKKIFSFDKDRNFYFDSINIEQPFLYKLFNQYKIFIVLKQESEHALKVSCVSESEKEKFVEFFKKQLNKKYSSKLVYQPDKKNVLIMAFFSGNLLIAFFFLYDIFENISYLNFKITYNLYYIFFLIFFIFTAIVILQLNRYGKYSIILKKNTVYKKYGLLNKEEKKVELSNVNTIISQQNLFMKLLKLSNIYILTTKNDSSKSELKNLLFPYITIKNLAYIVANYLEEFDILRNILEKIEDEPSSRYIFVDILYATIACSIIYISSIKNLWWLLSIIVLFIIRNYIISYLVAISVKNGVLLYYPGIFIEKKVFILSTGIEIIRYSKNIFTGKYSLVVNSNNIPSKKYVIRGIDRDKFNRIVNDLHSVYKKSN